MDAEYGFQLSPSSSRSSGSASWNEFPEQALEAQTQDVQRRVRERTQSILQDTASHLKCDQEDVRIVVGFRRANRNRSACRRATRRAFGNTQCDARAERRPCRVQGD